MSLRRRVAALAACAVLAAACIWSLWWPTRTFSDDRSILQRAHIDYGAALADDASAASSDYKLRFLRTSGDKVRVDFDISVDNEDTKELRTTCYYLVPPGSELLDTTSLDLKIANPDGRGTFTVTGDDLAKWEIPLLNAAGVTILHKYDDQGFWLYQQPCAVPAANRPGSRSDSTSASSVYGASFSVPRNVYFRTAYRSYELDFDLQGVPIFGYAGDDIPSSDAIEKASWIGDVTYELDGKGWPITSRVPDGNELVTATTSMAAYQVTPKTGLDSPALSHPNFAMQGSGGSLPFTMIQIVTTLLLGVLADRLFEGFRNPLAIERTDSRRRGATTGGVQPPRRKAALSQSPSKKRARSNSKRSNKRRKG